MRLSQDSSAGTGQKRRRGDKLASKGQESALTWLYHRQSSCKGGNLAIDKYMTFDHECFLAIYFIRHGQSEFNATFTGTTDPMIFDAPLTKLGLAQALKARDNVSKLGITRVVTSPFTRAIQTAQTIFDGVAPIEVQNGHHELLPDTSVSIGHLC